MSLFDDNDKVGLAMIILAVVTFVMAIVGVVLVFTNDGDKLPGILSAIGSALAGVIYFGFGKKLRNNEFTGKMNILVAFIKVTALVTLINGIFSIPSWVNVAVYIVIAAVLYWCTMKMTDGQTTISDNVIWVVLLVLFILGLISSIMLILGIITIPLAICGIIIYGFMIKLLLDPEVKSAMGL